MELKNIYEVPEMNLIFLESEDTICTSEPNIGDITTGGNEVDIVEPLPSPQP